MLTAGKDIRGPDRDRSIYQYCCVPINDHGCRFNFSAPDVTYGRWYRQCMVLSLFCSLSLSHTHTLQSIYGKTNERIEGLCCIYICRPLCTAFDPHRMFNASVAVAVAAVPNAMCSYADAHSGLSPIIWGPIIYLKKSCLM